MQTRRSSVLGKRAHQPESPCASTGEKAAKQTLPTPESTPKRARFSSTVLDGDHNKENIPPLNTDVTMASPSSSPSRSPARARGASLKRTASTSRVPPNTPTSEIAQLSLATPPITPPRELLPAYARARALLRATANNTSTQFAGRDAERQTIIDFIASFQTSGNEEKQQACMYISGSPGCGKTALVNSILDSMSLDKSDDIKVVFLNCMALKNVDALWERLAESLGSSKGKGRSKPQKGRPAVDQVLRDMKNKCLLILDELDHITTSSQSLQSLFSLVSSAPDVLRVIGIANTHTLTSSSTSMAAEFPDVKTVHFAPYTSTELLSIMKSRLTPLTEDDSNIIREHASKLLPTPALTLLSKKVASMTGDVRSLFEVLRGAIDLAVAAADSGKDDDVLGGSPPVVTPASILSALKAHAPANPSASSKPSTTGNSETCNKIQGLGIQAQLVLLSVLLAAKRAEVGLQLLPTSSSSATPASPSKRSRSPMKRTQSVSSGVIPTTSPDTNQLYSYYQLALNRSSAGIFSSTSRSEFGDLIGMLEGVGLLQLSSASPSASSGKAKRTFGRTASFSGANGGIVTSQVKLAGGVWADEILRGMGVQTSTDENMDADPRVRGARSVWELESKKINNELAALERGRKAQAAKDVMFDDAVES